MAQVLVVGVGSIGERHTRCFLATNRVEVAICDTNGQLAQEVGSRYSAAAIFDEFDTAIQHRPDAVVVATPAHLHISMATAAVEAGLPVLLEKPLSTTTEGVADLVALSESRSVPIMVAYVMRVHPALQAMQRALSERRFGRPVHLYCTSGQHFPTYRPAYRDIYYRSRATGGGAIQDALTHTMNTTQWLIGPITKLFADASHQLLDGVDVEDTVNVVARHGSVLASYAFNQFQAPNETRITVVCEKGTVRFEGDQKRWGWNTVPETPWEYETFPELERDTLFVRQADHFLDFIAGKSGPTCSLREAWQTLEVNLASLASADTVTRWFDVPHRVGTAEGDAPPRRST